MFPDRLRGFIAFPPFGDQAFDFGPFLLRIGISLCDFAREEEYALISHLKNNRRAFLKVEDRPDWSRHGDLSLRRHFGDFDEFHGYSFLSYILTIPPFIRNVNSDIIETQRTRRCSQ